MTEAECGNATQPTAQAVYSDTLAARLREAYEKHRVADPVQLRGGTTHRILGDLLYGHVPQIIEALALMDGIIRTATIKSYCGAEGCPGDQTCEEARHCMCGSRMEDHDFGSGHSPVSMHDYYSSQLDEQHRKNPKSVVGVGPPAAWQCLDDDGTSTITTDRGIAAAWRKAGCKVRPLYADALLVPDKTKRPPTVILSEEVPLSKVSGPTSDRSPYSFQNRAYHWQVAMLGEKRGMDPIDRGRRFVEEALEFSQSIGVTIGDVRLIADAVYGKPKGDPTAECGAALFTLAMAATTAGVQLLSAGETELERVTAKLEDIRSKDRMMQEQGLIVIPAEETQPIEPSLSLKDTLPESITGERSSSELVEVSRDLVKIWQEAPYGVSFGSHMERALGRLSTTLEKESKS